MRGFLAEEIGFLDIVPVVEETLANLPAAAPRAIEDVRSLDTEARRTAEAILARRRK